MSPTRALCLLALSLSACSAADEGTPAEPPALEPLPPAPPPRCAAPEGVSASPATIEEATALLNALPKPTSVACFVESLARPLAIHATSSVVSAQPAHSAASPRVFIQFGRLWLSVVVDGIAAHLLEFSYQLPEAELFSIKAELELPLEAAVPLSAPYDHVRSNVGTKCGSCHRGEYRVAEVTAGEAFASQAIRAFPSSHVTVEALRAEHTACDAASTPNRCEMLSALFDGGPVLEASFPASWLTFF